MYLLNSMFNSNLNQNFSQKSVAFSLKLQNLCSIYVKKRSQRKSYRSNPLGCRQ